MLNKQKKKCIRELRAFADELVGDQVGEPMEIYKLVLDGATAINECEGITGVAATYKEYMYRLSQIRIGPARDARKYQLNAYANELLKTGNAIEDDIIRALEEADAAFDACTSIEDLEALYMQYLDRISRCNLYDQIRIYMDMLGVAVSSADIPSIDKEELMSRARNSLAGCKTREEMDAIMIRVNSEVEYLSTPIDELKYRSKNRLLEKAKEYMNTDNLGALYIALSEAFAKIDECRELYQIELLEQDIMLLLGEYNVDGPLISR